MTKNQREAKAPKQKIRRITVRLSEEEFERVVSRAKDWQAQGIGSRSLNDFCLIQLIGEADGNQSVHRTTNDSTSRVSR